MCRPPIHTPCVQTTPAASALLLVQFFWTSQQCEQQKMSLADPQQSSQSQRMFFVMMIKNAHGRLQTSAIDVCKCGKTMFAALKRERGRRAGKGRKRQTWSRKKNSSCFEPLVGVALNRLLTVKSTAMKVRFASGAKNKFAAFPRTQRNQTRISFVISWEKFLGWNVLPFNCSSRAFGG